MPAALRGAELREMACVSTIPTPGQTGFLRCGVSAVQPLSLSAPSPSPPASWLGTRPGRTSTRAAGIGPGGLWRLGAGPEPGPPSREAGLSGGEAGPRDTRSLRGSSCPGMQRHPGPPSTGGRERAQTPCLKPFM